MIFDSSICHGLTHATHAHAHTKTLNVRRQNIVKNTLLQLAVGARVDQLDHLACRRQVLD